MVDVVVKSADGKSVSVSDDGKLEVFAIQETQLEHTSAIHGQAFAWYSTYTVGSAGEEIISIKNDSSDLLLHLDQVWIGSSTAGEFSLGYLLTGTPGGTTITGVPLNKDKSKTADATAFGSASVTGSLTFTTLANILNVAAGMERVDLEGAWILGKDDTFVISAIIDTNLTYCTVIGHFDTEGT